MLRFCSWKATRSYIEYIGKKFEDGRNPPKSVYKYPPWSGGDHTVLRFSLLRGIEWFRPQHPRDVLTNSLQNCELKIHWLQKFPGQTKNTLKKKRGKIIMPSPELRWMIPYQLPSTDRTLLVRNKMSSHHAERSKRRMGQPRQSKTRP